MVELTLEQVKKVPANFMYLWASDEFLSYIDSKHAEIIKGKRINQNKVILLSVEKYGGTKEDYYNAIRTSFQNAFGIDIPDALVKLAQGETIAGKNWEAGVYGIGAAVNANRQSTFSQNSNITVNQETGQIMLNGEVMEGATAIYGSAARKNKVIGYSVTDSEGNTYTSQYRAGHYYCGSYTNADGSVYQNALGTSITTADSMDIWESILSRAQSFVEWLLNLLGIKTASQQAAETGNELITDENTLPNQKKDGFVSTNTESSASTWLLPAVIGGGLLIGFAPKLFGGFWKKARKSKRRR